jgi:Ca2+-binding EF-hand superfamily protein
LKSLPEEKREAFFGRLDSDSDGFVSGEEIRAMRQQADRRAMEGFRKLDTDGSGGVSF